LWTEQLPFDSLIKFHHAAHLAASRAVCVECRQLFRTSLIANGPRRFTNKSGNGALRPAREFARSDRSNGRGGCHVGYRAYSVIKREGREDYWLNLRVAFKHKNGQGFNILLQGMPPDGKLVLRTYKEREENQVKVIRLSSPT